MLSAWLGSDKDTFLRQCFDSIGVRTCGFESHDLPKRGYMLNSFSHPIWSHNPAFSNYKSTVKHTHRCWYSLRTLSGFTEHKGNCAGVQYRRLARTRQECATECRNDPKCKAFLYVHDTLLDYGIHRCFLKSEKCTEMYTLEDFPTSLYTKDGKQNKW